MSRKLEPAAGRRSSSLPMLTLALGSFHGRSSSAPTSVALASNAERSSSISLPVLPGRAGTARLQIFAKSSKLSSSSLQSRLNFSSSNDGHLAECTERMSFNRVASLWKDSNRLWKYGELPFLLPEVYILRAGSSPRMYSRTDTIRALSLVFRGIFTPKKVSVSSVSASSMIGKLTND
ncbi:hypothetical protein D3C86_1529500 [compost metagenome]